MTETTVEPVAGGPSTCTVHGAKNSPLVTIAIWSSLLGNSLLFIVKYWVGVVSGSLALQADAWHTMSDTLSTIVVMVGLRVSRKPADDTHPYGHGRYELVATVVVGLMLAVIAFYFIQEGILQLVNHKSATFGTAAIVVTILSIVVKEALAQVAFRAAKKSGLASLKADGWHHRSDALSSVVVLGGILAGRYLWYVDGVLGISVGVLILYVGYTTIRDAASTIAGERPPALLHDSIVAHLKGAYPELNLAPHDFRWHNYVRTQEITFHIALPAGMTVQQSYDIISSLEKSIYQNLGIYTTIHVEPEGEENPTSAL